MPRTRLINPEFFLHEGLGESSPHARLLFIALWTQADRDGRFRWLPLKIHGETFPHEPEVNVKQLAEELILLGSLSIYEEGKKVFGEVINFRRWQSPHRNEQASKIPERPEGHAQEDDSLSILWGSPTKGRPKDDPRTIKGSADTSSRSLVLNTRRPSSRVSPERPRPDVSPGLSVPTGDVLVDFLLETWGKKGLLGRHDTLEKWVESARGGYPAVDLLVEAKKAHAWEESNPTKKKKKIRPFLSRWWSKVQDRGGTSSSRPAGSEDEDLATLEAFRQLGGAS